MTPITLPEPARAGLAALYQQMKQAELLYRTAANAALAALGLDPQANNTLDLDTGIITPAAPQDAT